MIEFVASHGAQLAAGLSLLLAIALVVRRAHACPARRHRWAEGVLLCVPLCAALLALPMERALLLIPNAEPDLAAIAAAPSPLGGALLGAAAVPAATDTLSPAPPILAVLFTLGTALVLLHLFCGVLLLAQLLRGARELRGAPRRFRSSGPRVLIAQGARRPFCIGTPRLGLIVLPAALADPTRADQLEAVLAHERTHLEDGHGRARLLASALAPLLYWNPLYWLLVARMRTDAELCADDAAAQEVGKARYVRALLALVEDSPPERCHAFSPQASLARPLLGVLAPARPFLQRMESLMLRPQAIDRSTSRLWRTTSITVLACAVAVINAACGTTANTGTRAVRPIAVPFEALSLDGTGLGSALSSDAAIDPSFGASIGAPFPERVKAFDGKAVAMDGYVIPLSWTDDDRVDEFMLVRDFAQCCQGGAPPWDHWLHARSDGEGSIPFELGQRVRVEGRLQLVHPRDWPTQEYTTGIYELSGCSGQAVE